MERIMSESRRARVLDVGQCSPDRAGIKSAITRRFDADIDHVMFVDDALEAMRLARYDLVLVNRRIFDDDSDGLELIRRSKADPALAPVPIMMVSNYPEAQQAAIAAGAEPGFGKSQLHEPVTHERLGRFLPARSA